MNNLKKYFIFFISCIPFSLYAIPSDMSGSPGSPGSTGISKEKKVIKTDIKTIKNTNTQNSIQNTTVDAPETIQNAPNSSSITSIPGGSGILENESLNVSDRLDEAVLKWASEKVIYSFTYNWVDYKDITNKAKNYFTPQGYAHYLKSLKDSGSTESVINKKLILQVKPNGFAKILKEGIYQDKYSWQVEVPLYFTYYGVSETIPRKASVIVLVSRVSKVDFSDGLAIAQLLLKPDS